ncbi:CinA family protein [Aquibium carbonis]|uniref:CinA family protein n=1 Tax=Aquibium carbonis TaxID=2495581 RepID=A0A3S0A6Q3_9HYPH|nr:CinA family protein [Aquibium carbonis]RST86001.1 CinA family protein [Aquibium carbonis]
MSPHADLARALLEACAAEGITVSTAESCTGGLISAALTDIAGSSIVVDRGFVTYSNEAKMEMLGVAEATLSAHGAVSAETAREMAAGALSRSKATMAVAVTGIAGPGGGSEEKPIGLVWFGLAARGAEVVAVQRLFEPKSRDHVRQQTVRTALELMLARLTRP